MSDISSFVFGTVSRESFATLFQLFLARIVAPYTTFFDSDGSPCFWLDFTGYCTQSSQWIDSGMAAEWWCTLLTTLTYVSLVVMFHCILGEVEASLYNAHPTSSSWFIPVDSMHVINDPIDLFRLEFL